MKKRIIGLTGGIACGKSTVSAYLSRTYSIPVLDADVYAREAVTVGSPILARIFDRYGEKVQQSDRSLNRQKLGEIIFGDAREKQWLESQIHPYVRECFARDSASITSSTVVFSIPLLFEAGLTGLVTEIWVVYCAREEQIRRIQERDKLTREQAIARIENQMPIDKKIALGDVILENGGSLESLYRQIALAIEPSSFLPS
jgi:dephospho-CoA kinase